MNTLLALWQTHIQSWGFVDWIKFIIIVAACLGVMFICLRVFGITVPVWVWQIIGIVACAFLAILAVTFLASL